METLHTKSAYALFVCIIISMKDTIILVALVVFVIALLAFVTKDSPDNDPELGLIGQTIQENY